MAQYIATENPELNKSVVITICKAPSGLSHRAGGLGVRSRALGAGAEPGACPLGHSTRRPPPASSLHGSHVIFWEQRDLQDFGVGQDGFMAGGGDSLPRDPVDLVEGMGPEQAVVCCPNEQL